MMGGGRRVATLAGALWVIAACTGPEPLDPSLTTVRDSAGIQIVEHTRTDGIRAPWRIRKRPVFRTGWYDDEPTFEYIRQGEIGSDGRILLTDANGTQLYLLDQDGELIQTLGGPGQGPGEFSVTVEGAVFGGGDTIHAQDRSALSTFADGRVLHDRVAPWGWDLGPAGVSLITARSDGRLVLIPRTIDGGMYGENQWLRAPTVSMDPTVVEQIDTLFEADFIQLRPRDDAHPIRFYGVAAARGDFLAHGRIDRPEVRWYDADGSLSRIARWDPASAELTEADWDAYAAARRGLSSPEITSERTERALREAREAWGGPRPAFKLLHLDSEANVWFTDFAVPFTEAESGFVIAANGDWLGAIDFPTEMHILDVTDTHLLATETDEYDVIAVSLYEIAKPGR